MRPGDGGAVDEFGLPVLSSIVCYDAPDGGVWIAIAPMRPIADEIEGKPDERVVPFVMLTAESRVRLGVMFATGHSFGPPPTPPSPSG